MMNKRSCKPMEKTIKTMTSQNEDMTTPNLDDSSSSSSEEGTPADILPKQVRRPRVRGRRCLFKRHVPKLPNLNKEGKLCCPVCGSTIISLESSNHSNSDHDHFRHNGVTITFNCIQCLQMKRYNRFDLHITETQSSIELWHR